MQITIAGAGIGGLAAALKLAGAGHEIRVYEQRDSFDESGAGIQVSPNASRILIDMGLGGALGEVAVAPTSLVIRRMSEPRAFAQMSLADIAARHGAPYWCLRRSDLHRVLHEAAMCTPGIVMERGVTIAGIKRGPASVTATLTSADGQRRPLETPLLVAADGLWSTLAQEVVPGQPKFTGYEAWRATISSDAIAPFLRAPFVGLWMGQAAHLVHYPVGNGHNLNIVLVRAAKTAGEGWSRPGDPAELAPLRKASTKELAALLGAVPEWQVWSLFDHPARPMANGRLALLGDAAHPVLPFLAQGAALAIEDAAVLASTLQGVADIGLAAALKRYDRERRPRVARVQQAARANGKTFHMADPLARFRDTGIAWLGSERMGRRYEWLYGWRHKAP